MEAFTAKEYARDMDIPEKTALNVITRGIKKGLLEKAHKIKLNGRTYQTYCYAGELAAKEFVMPESCFWNDPFNKTRKAK